MKFTPVRLAQALLSQMPVSDGQLIFAYDTGNVYVDTAYGRFQQGISMLSDSSEIPLAPADKLYFNKDTKQLLYNGLSVFAEGMQKVAVESDAVALAGKWYLCFNDAVITLPAVHNENDTVKVSTVLDVNNVAVRPANGDTVQSDSGFLLNVNNSSVELTWLDDRWVASLVIIPRLKAPFAVVDGLPVVGEGKVYYNTLTNKLNYWDGSWKGVADFLDRISTLLQEHSTLYSIKLGKCSDLGIVYGSDSIQLTWTDPLNVLLDTAVLAEWKQTVLLKKKGLYPVSALDSDAQLVAVTSRLLGNKNGYSGTPIHESPSDSTYYKLFSQSMSGVWNNITANCYPLATAMSWGMVQAFVRAGRGPDVWPVGTIFLVAHPLYTVNNHGIYFRVSGYNQVPAADQSLTNTMCLLMVDVLFSAAGDASLPLYAFTADTTAQADKLYYTYDGSSYSKLALGTDYDIGDNVPELAWYLKNLLRNNGSNNPKENNLIQWANSTGSANQWFTPQTIWDTCSSVLAAKNGFMKYLDPDFAAVVKEAKLTTALCTALGGGSLTHNAKFWPLSVTQVFGNANNGVYLNTQLSYYSDGGSAVKKTITNLSMNWRLRSPLTSTASITYTIGGGGTSDIANASGDRGYSFACIIA